MGGRPNEPALHSPGMRQAWAHLFAVADVLSDSMFMHTLISDSMFTHTLMVMCASTMQPATTFAAATPKVSLHIICYMFPFAHKQRWLSTTGGEACSGMLCTAASGCPWLPGTPFIAPAHINCSAQNIVQTLVLRCCSCSYCKPWACL